MIKIKNKADSRRRLEPPWGWSGIGDSADLSSLRDQVAAAVDLMPTMLLDRKEIVAKVLDLGAQFHRNLHQDEFGLTRADRVAAMTALSKSIDGLFERLAKLSVVEKELIGAAPAPFALSDIAAGPDPGEIVREATGCILFVYETARACLNMARVTAPGSVKPFEQLIDAANATQAFVNMLDTTSEFEIMVTAIPAAADGDRVERPMNEGGALGIACTRISRLRFRVDATRAALSKQKGPEVRVSLPVLVGQLADVWGEATGQIATSSGVSDYKYTAVPQSPAGRFIVAAIEAVRPPMAWFDERRVFAVSVTAQIMAGQPINRARAINTALSDYVRFLRNPQHAKQQPPHTS